MRADKFDMTGAVLMLVTTDDFFYAKDGRQYRSVIGNGKIFQDTEILEFKSKNTANYYIVIGEEEPVIIAGCRVHYCQILTNYDGSKDTCNNLLGSPDIYDAT